ncbi:MAG: OmpA family protein [Myxococcales bacterium]|nr:OmpA family protein [Myxococcales bacterium]
MKRGLTRFFDNLRLSYKANARIERIMIEGHTDSRGDREKNVDLSERRARRVMSFLVQEGVLPKRLRSKGYGQLVT